MKAIIVGSLVCVLGTSSLAADDRTEQRASVEQLSKLATMCEGNECGKIVAKVKLKVNNKDVDAIKLVTPSGIYTYFDGGEKNGSRSYCWCVDCVSVDYSFQCMLW